MIHEASAMTVRKNLGALLNEVQYHHDTIVIKKSGKAVAALIDIHYFKKICKIKERYAVHQDINRVAFSFGKFNPLAQGFFHSVNQDMGITLAQ